MTAAPGCFGSVMYHDAESRRCTVCPHLDNCKSAVAENKQKLEEWAQSIRGSDRSTAAKRKRACSALGKPTATRVRKVEVVTTDDASAPAPKADLTHLPVKVREFVQKWEAKGIDFKAYRDNPGVNPFASSGNRFAVAAMDLLLREGSVTKLQMTEYLMEHGGARGPWGSGTACSHAGIALDAFEHLGIITLHEGKAYLVR